jgi:hypothetical protein
LNDVDRHLGCGDPGTTGHGASSDGGCVGRESSTINVVCPRLLDHTTTDGTVHNSDGSTTETVMVDGATAGHAISETMTTTSANSLSTTVDSASTGKPWQRHMGRGHDGSSRRFLAGRGERRRFGYARDPVSACCKGATSTRRFAHEFMAPSNPPLNC